MKMVTMAASALVLALAIGSTVLAGTPTAGMNGGCGNCGQAGAPVPGDQLRKFQLDTIDLRQEMMLKRFAVQRENLKATPDNVKVASLNAEIKAIQATIHTIRIQSGLPEMGLRDGECGPMTGKGGCGNGQAGGCNGGPCGSR